MQLKIKQIGSSLMGAVLTGATLLGGALAADISDFQKMGPSDTVVVVGASAATSDVVGAIDIGASMYGHGVTATSAGGAAVTTVEGGANLATSTRALFLNDKLNAAGKTTLTKTDLPTTLASKTFSDSVGTSYKYDQFIELGSTTSQLTYGKPSGQNEPMGYINMTSGTSSVTSSAYTYQSKVVFNDAINLSSTNVQGQTITLFGTDYTIGSSSTSGATQKLILFGSGNSAMVAEGDEATIMVGSTEHKVKVDIVSDGSNAYLIVDGGASTKVTNKALYTINGVDVYINDIVYVSKTGGISKVKVSLGSGRITLENGQAVKQGSSDTAIDGTKVAITGTGQMSTLTVAVGAKDSSSAFIQEGGNFNDPVFGTFKLSFSGYSPKLDDASRSTIALTASGNDRASVKFTDNNGNEKQIDFAKDPNTGTSGSTFAFTDANDKAYHVVEGEAAGTDEYIVADANDMSHLFKVGSISSFGLSGAKATLTDVFTGTNQVFNLDAAGYTNGTLSIDGQSYYINVSSASGPVKLTWVAGTDLQRGAVTDTAAAANTTYTTIYPGLKAKNGEKVYLTNASTITLAANTTSNFILPTGVLKVRYSNPAGGADGNYSVSATADAGDPLTARTAALTASTPVLIGTQYYNLQTDAMTAATSTLVIRPQTGAAATTNVTQPAILIKEKKNIDSAYNTILLTLTDDSTGIRVDNTPVFTGFSGSGTSTSSTSVSKYVDYWGTAIDRDTTSRGTLTLRVPDTQVTGGVYVLTAAATAPTTTTTGTANVNLPSLGSGLGKLDSEISAEKTTKNLILVGGPYVNTLVEELAGKGKTPTKAEWSANLQGKAIVQAIGDAFAPGKTALVVSGWSAQDSRVATLKLASSGKTFKGAAQQEIGGVWSAFAYPFAVQTTTTNTTTNTTGR